MVENAVPRIITDKLFNKVQVIRKKKKKTPPSGRATEEYILTTKLFCGHCREMMTGTSGTGKLGKIYNYYACKNAIKKKGCKKKNVKKNLIEDFIIAKAREQLTNENINIIAKAIKEISEKENNSHVVGELKRKLKENEKAIENLLVAIESGEHISLLSDRITKKQEEKAALEKMLAIESMEKIQIDESEIRFFLHQLKKGDINDMHYKRALVAAFVNSIYLFDDKARIIYNACGSPVEIDCELLNEIENLENGDMQTGQRCSYAPHNGSSA